MNKKLSLKRLRIEAGFGTIAAVCRATGTSYNTWQSWEDDTVLKVPPVVYAYLELATKIQKFALGFKFLRLNV